MVGCEQIAVGLGVSPTLGLQKANGCVHKHPGVVSRGHASASYDCGARKVVRMQLHEIFTIVYESYHLRKMWE